MNLLIVEDEKDKYNDIAKALKRDRNIYILPQCDFDDKVFEIYKIDLVVLDLNSSNGISGDTDAGDKIIKKIYQHSFIPIIIHSAFAAEYENPYKDNFFISTVNKGPDSIANLKKEVKKYSPFVNNRSMISDAIDFNIGEIYRTTYEKMVKNTTIKQNGNPELFTNLIKRRLAVSIDASTDNKPINAWEIYLYPCLGERYLTGDILRRKKAKKDDPASYKIILSPSCDLQTGEGRTHIQNVKVASFKNICDYCKKSELKSKKLRDTSPERFVFFHKLEGEFPHMLCDFKELEIVDFDDLDKKFERIVSIDSPFREAIVWADITVNGRPGLPDRNCENWLASIKEECYRKP